MKFSISSASPRPGAFALKFLLILGICWFYVWTAAPEWRPGLIASEDGGYYNLLTRGFLKGHLYFDAPADPFLATLSNPWDPDQRGDHGMPDSSYFKGHYYSYFGVSPAVLLFLPFRLLTGKFISERLATAVFACVGFVVSAGLLLAVRRRFFPRVPAMLAAACVLALGLGDMMPVLLRRPSFREVPIACGYACCMTGVAALYRALQGRRSAPWLMLSSAAFGLAVGSRPLYLLACPVVLLPAWWQAREKGLGRGCWRDPAWRRDLIAATVPMALVGLGLACYNFARFGRPAEFGLSYQIWLQDPAKSVRFAWRFFSYDLKAFWLLPAGWVHYFPFVTFVALPAGPYGFYGGEDPYGILPNMPFAVLALGFLTVGWRRAPGRRGSLRAFGAIVVLAAGAMAVPLLFFQAALNRYMVDFVPLVMFTASLGLLALASRPWWRGAVATSGAIVVCGLSGYSAVVNVLASFRHNELFQAEHPAIYARIAHRWNWLPYEYDRWRGTEYGPLALKLSFPLQPPGLLEPLVVTGRLFLSDYLFVYYPKPGWIEFGLEHTSRGAFFGAPMAVDPKRVYDVQVDLGSLYPPADHPYFDAMPPAEARLRQNTMKVTVDGEVAFYHIGTTYESTGPDPSIGSAGDRGPYSHPFSGRILSWRRVPGAPVAIGGPRDAPLQIALKLPPFHAPGDEPLVARGERGRGDLVYLRSEGPAKISIGYSRDGLNEISGPPFSVDPRALQVLEVNYPARQSAPPLPSAPDSPAPGGFLFVSLNGNAALTAPVGPFAFPPSPVAVGFNGIQSEIASAAFTGDFVALRRKQTDETAPRFGRCRLEILVPPFAGVRNEPLVCAGVTGRGDLVYIRYLGPSTIAFGYDHWGVGGPVSAACAVDPMTRHVVEIDFGGLHRAAPAGPGPWVRPLRILLDSRAVLDQAAPSYPSNPDSVAIGLNSIHASTAIPRFSGEFLDVQRSGDP